MTADAGPTGVETSEHLAVALRSEGGARGLHLIREELDVRILLLQPRVVELTVDLLDRWIALLPCERSEEHTSELQSLMRISYAAFCLKKKIKTPHTTKY